LSWILLALAISCAAGCEFPGQPRDSDRYKPPKSETSFQVLFQKNCVGCHGTNGELGPAPPLKDKLFLALVPDAELLRVITDGRAGTMMPAFATNKGGQLTAEQVNILASGIKPRWGSAEPVSIGAPSYSVPQARAEGVAAGDQEAGQMAFARACASCHGEQGRGGKSGDSRVGAINDPEFLALISDQALRRYVITGRPDLGMPDYADPMGRPKGFTPLTSDDVTNITALLASWRQGRSGTGKRGGD
jgi:cytochrome c oxidase cbb3-type subunit 3/ubiquinol-cytochrome c reductase cytochrome c subunit